MIVWWPERVARLRALIEGGRLLAAQKRILKMARGPDRESGGPDRRSVR